MPYPDGDSIAGARPNITKPVLLECDIVCRCLVFCGTSVFCKRAMQSQDSATRSGDWNIGARRVFEIIYVSDHVYLAFNSVEYKIAGCENWDCGNGWHDGVSRRTSCSPAAGTPCLERAAGALCQACDRCRRGRAPLSSARASVRARRAGGANRVCPSRRCTGLVRRSGHLRPPLPGCRLPGAVDRHAEPRTRGSSPVAAGRHVFCTAAPFSTSLCLFVFHTGRHRALVDDRLAVFDRALAFDWIGYARWFDLHPLAWSASKLFYESIFIQFPCAILCLAMMRSAPRLYAYICAQILSLSLVAVMSGFFPAIGAYEQSGAAHAGFIHSDFLTADRMTGSIRWLRSETLAGNGLDCYTLTSFPPYHAVCAVLFMFAYWHVPRVRWVGIFLNLGMLAATPVQGSHYLVDILAGVCVAAFSLLVCSLCISRATKATGVSSAMPVGAVPVAA